MHHFSGRNPQRPTIKECPTWKDPTSEEARVIRQGGSATAGGAGAPQQMQQKQSGSDGSFGHTGSNPFSSAQKASANKYPTSSLHQPSISTMFSAQKPQKGGSSSPHLYSSFATTGAAASGRYDNDNLSIMYEQAFKTLPNGDQGGGNNGGDNDNGGEDMTHANAVDFMG